MNTFSVCVSSRPLSYSKTHVNVTWPIVVGVLIIWLIVKGLNR
jgi:hypothetical protein